MMSGSVLAPWAFQVNPRANARILANNLRCYDYDAAELLQCLQVMKNLVCVPKKIPPMYIFLIAQIFELQETCSIFRTSQCWTLLRKLIGWYKMEIRLQYFHL